ncbi:host specificity protein [Bradyrhizobium sp. 2S1]|uniref:host specificity protein n=1 Tax=Bradyrhizobium sp. 2S1 TaxID=1404429 RepID=UPI001CD0AAC6|nr:host specificity protein [Bradyrhizobium sp. 2S1]MCK7672738.1 host specificity protein [Bradyrhizobium sp. 2S1]
MYGRIVGSSSQSGSASHVDESGDEGESPRFADTVAGMEPGASSSVTTMPYSLASDPPIIEIDRSSFTEGVRRFLGGDIRHIASNPEEYSDFVSGKARRAGMVAGSYLHTYDDPSKPARFYSYQLGDETVGLLRAGGPARIKGEQFRQQFGRNDITSVVDLRVTHPLVENAGDILLEHQLRQDGDHPLVLSRPGLEGMEPRLAEMGFVHMGRNYWALDPNQHPEVWTKNESNEWQRVDKPTKYLTKVEDSDTASEASVESAEAASSDDDPSFYLEQALEGLRME